VCVCVTHTSSFKPMLRTVSSIPGIETRAPDRTATYRDIL
jgi:hypothetical protein